MAINCIPILWHVSTSRYSLLSVFLFDGVFLFPVTKSDS